MTEADTKEAIFGSFDGLTSALGVIAGLIVAGTHTGSHIFAAALGLAVAATIGMGAGQYLSDTNKSLRLAGVMAAATLTGSMLPALPFITGYGTIQLVVSLCLTVVAAGVIGRFRGYRLTFTVLLIVAALTVGLSALVA